MSESMTGFGRGEAENQDCKIVVEVKSVNHRFKDYRFKLPNNLSSMENDLRKKLGEKFSRGFFEVSSHIKSNKSELVVENLDMDKIKLFLDEFCKQMKDYPASVSIKPTDFLRAEFTKNDKLSFKDQELLDFFIKTFDLALDDLKKSRVEEGTKLVLNIRNHISVFEENIEKIHESKTTFKSIVRSKLDKALKELECEVTLDNNRLMQEIVYYLEKMDIDEELNRISAHMLKVKSLMNSVDRKGRHLEFFIQELGREVNTIASKSSNEKISEYVVLMKVELEKIREQSLNLE